MRIKFKPAVLALLVLLSLFLPHGAAAEKPIPPPKKAVWDSLDVEVGIGPVYFYNEKTKEVLVIEATGLYDEKHNRIDPPAPNRGQGYFSQAYVIFSSAPDGLNLQCTFPQKNCLGLLRADGGDKWPSGRIKTGLEGKGISVRGYIRGLEIVYIRELWTLSYAP